MVWAWWASLSAEPCVVSSDAGWELAVSQQLECLAPPRAKERRFPLERVYVREGLVIVPHAVGSTFQDRLPPLVRNFLAWWDFFVLFGVDCCVEEGVGV